MTLCMFSQFYGARVGAPMHPSFGPRVIQQIWNCDESGIPLSPKASKLVARKGDKDPSYVITDIKAHVTMLLAIVFLHS